MITPDIPLLDITVWREGSRGDRERLAARMDQALRHSGFLMIENHGVPAALRDQIRAEAKRFFALPHERKAKYATRVAGRGWIPQGGEANAFYGEAANPDRADMKESLTIGRSFRTGDPETDRKWFTPNVWPGECPELESRCERFTAQVRDLYYDLLRISAAALGLAEDFFAGHARRAPHTFNINRYPPLTATGPAKEGQFRVAPHTDWGILTILDRQPGYGGLQIQTRGNVGRRALCRRRVHRQRRGPALPVDRGALAVHQAPGAAAAAPGAGRGTDSLIVFLGRKSTR